MAKLSPRHRTFIKEYLKDKNASRAYRAVYGDKAGANKHGSRLMANEGIRQAIEKGLARLETKLEITAERVLANIANIAFDNTKTIATRDKLKANELLGRNLNMFQGDDVSVSVSTGPVATDKQVKAAVEEAFKKL